MSASRYIPALISFLALSLSDCTERIEVKIDSSYTRLVVEGYVTTDTMPQWVKLSTTSDYFYNQPAPRVSGAHVTIDDGERVYELEESDSLPGMYFTALDFYGVPGRTYTLDIRNVDVNRDGLYEEYSASSELNPVNPIDSIRLRYFEAFGNSGYEVRVWAQDPPRKDWYSFKVHKNGVLLTDTLAEMIVQNDDFFNGNYTYGITSQFLSNDKPDEIVSVGDTITFEINGITEDYYHFIMEAQSQIYGQTPLFSGPPANIRTNLSNGAIGYFTAWSTAYSSTVATEEVVSGGVRR
jgi:hypothetical protein